MSELVSIEDVRIMLSFCPECHEVPVGLDPTFYFTLSAAGDQVLMDRLAKIRAKLPEPPEPVNQVDAIRKAGGA